MCWQSSSLGLADWERRAVCTGWRCDSEPGGGGSHSRALHCDSPGRQQCPPRLHAQISSCKHHLSSPCHVVLVCCQALYDIRCSMQRRNYALVTVQSGVVLLLQWPCLSCGLKMLFPRNCELQVFFCLLVCKLPTCQSAVLKSGRGSEQTPQIRSLSAGLLRSRCSRHCIIFPPVVNLTAEHSWV